jgi:hypothetical protein
VIVPGLQEQLASARAAIERLVHVSRACR